MIDTSIVIDKKDKEFIEEALNLYKNGFYRASYIMSWICCLESFRRKFFEMSTKESLFNDVWKKIETAEKAHQSIDRLVIDCAYNDTNLINEFEKQKLEYFYTMRCIYAHPYEQQPTAIDCEHIIESVINIGLSRETKLGKQSIDSIIKYIELEKTFLEDNEEKIKSYCISLIERTNPTVYAYFFEKLLELYEKSEKENESTFPYIRAKIMAITLLETVGIKSIFSDAEIENCIFEYKKLAVTLFSNYKTYENLSEHIKSIIFSELVENQNSERLSELAINSVLLEEQKIELKNKIRCSLISLDLGLFPAPYIIEKLINMLSTHDCYRQNAAISILKKKTVYNTLEQCTVDSLIKIGREILQSAHHLTENSYYSVEAFNFLGYLKMHIANYPKDLVKGIVAECFTNNNTQKIRPKIEQINCVEEILSEYNTKNQNIITEYTKQLIGDYSEIQNNGWEKISTNSFFKPMVDMILEKQTNSI